MKKHEPIASKTTVITIVKKLVVFNVSLLVDWVMAWKGLLLKGVFKGLNIFIINRDHFLLKFNYIKYSKVVLKTKLLKIVASLTFQQKYPPTVAE